ncbi:hypothetical protein [Stella sp.]|uniref:O-linked N-acetylglucosamine transferase family protein n=1 Tax=Stella sp. TaxID=2912054 RepID=UPI0035B07DD8
MQDTAAAPSPSEAERRILAGDLTAAAALLPDPAAPEAADPAWARLRLFLSLTGVLPGDAAARNAAARAAVPAAGRPPPDLPALASALPAGDGLQPMVEAERRLTLASAAQAEALLRQGEAQAARDLLEQTLASLTPSGPVFRLFGRANAELGRPSDAVFAFERAVDLAPGDRATRIDLATALPSVGDCEGAARMLAADAVGPEEAAAFSARLHAMARAEPDPAAIAAETRRYRAAAAARTVPPAPRAPLSGVPHVGFFWWQEQRAAGYWMTDLLRHRTPGRLRTTLYGIGLTRRFEGSDLARGADRVVVCNRAAPDAIARRMRDDGVDLLVSFIGHDQPDLLAVLDQRPARVHVEWLETGWPSGHPAVSHLLADRGHCPPDIGRSMDIRIVGFPTPAMSGGPALAAADAAGRERRAEQGFVYGWCGPASAIGERTMAVWARILREHPAARLRLLHEDWRIGTARERVATRLMELGIEGRRVDFDSPERLDGQTALWSRIDLGLDSFPTGDIATTFDALAMGVPLVTIGGPRHAGRHAAVALATLGMGDLVAADEDQYVAKALQAAARPGAVAELRRRIPDLLRASPLAGGPLQAQSFETAVELLLGIRRGA